MKIGGGELGMSHSKSTNLFSPQKLSSSPRDKAALNESASRYLASVKPLETVRCLLSPQLRPHLRPLVSERNQRWCLTHRKVKSSQQRQSKKFSLNNLQRNVLNKPSPLNPNCYRRHPPTFRMMTMSIPLIGSRLLQSPPSQTLILLNSRPYSNEWCGCVF